MPTLHSRCFNPLAMKFEPPGFQPDLGIPPRLGIPGDAVRPRPAPDTTDPFRLGLPPGPVPPARE